MEFSEDWGYVFFDPDNVQLGVLSINEMDELGIATHRLQDKTEYAHWVQMTSQTLLDLAHAIIKEYT